MTTAADPLADFAAQSNNQAGHCWVLPADYTFTAADQGTHTFSAAFVLLTSGPQTLTADDADGGFCGSAVLTVQDGGPPAPARPHVNAVDALFAGLALEYGGWQGPVPHQGDEPCFWTGSAPMRSITPQ
jgi:hypothetical protein